MKRKHEIKRTYPQITEKELQRFYEGFFEYFLGYHAIVCTDQGCVCRASTFMDMICEPRLRNSEKWSRDIEEVLARDKNMHK